jgi:uncharacterized protein (TIGR03435 family)
MHREMRDMPVSTIEIAKGGPRLQPASGACISAQESTVVPKDQQRCGEVVWRPEIDKEVMRHHYYGRSVSVGNLAAALSSNGPVVDDTGIPGLFDIDVTFESPLHRAGEDPDDADGIGYQYQRAFRDAFEKQLGLTIDLGKLKKHPMPFIVIDRVEMPTPN